MKIFQREQRSLFGEILDWMLTPLLLLWPVSLALTWLVAQSIAGKPFDRARARLLPGEDFRVNSVLPLVDRVWAAADASGLRARRYSADVHFLR